MYFKLEKCLLIYTFTLLSYMIITLVHAISKQGRPKKLSQRYDLKSPIGRKYRLCGNHNYTHVRILSAVSVEKDKAYSMENEAREVIKKMKGFVYIPNDRFRYFLLPQTIELPENEFTFVLDKNEYGEKYKIYGRFA